MMGADLHIILTDQDGVFTDNLRTNPNAKLIMSQPAMVDYLFDVAHGLRPTIPIVSSPKNNSLPHICVGRHAYLDDGAVKTVTEQHKSLRLWAC